MITTFPLQPNVRTSFWFSTRICWFLSKKKNQMTHSESFAPSLCLSHWRIAEQLWQAANAKNKTPNLIHTLISGLSGDTVRWQNRSWCCERLLEDLDGLKCKVLREVDTLRLTQCYKEKHGVLAPVDVLEHMKKLKELKAQGKEPRKRLKGKKYRRWGKQKSLLLFFNVEVGWKYWIWLNIYIHPLNMVCNSDCSYLERWNSTGALQLLLVRQSRAMKEYWVDAKWARTSTSVRTALSENNYSIVPFVSTHPRTECAMSYFIFRGCTIVKTRVNIRSCPRFTDEYIPLCDLPRLNPCTLWSLFIVFLNCSNYYFQDNNCRDVIVHVTYAYL